MRRQILPCSIDGPASGPNLFTEAGFQTDASSGISNPFEGTWKIRCRAQLTPAIGGTSPTAILKLHALLLLAALTSSSLRQNLSPCPVQSFEHVCQEEPMQYSYYLLLVVRVVVVAVLVWLFLWSWSWSLAWSSSWSWSWPAPAPAAAAAAATPPPPSSS